MKKNVFFVLIFAISLWIHSPPVSAEVTEPQIYWTSYSGGVHRSSLDGSNVKMFFSEEGEEHFPNSIAIDMAAGKVYWGDLEWKWLYRSSLDGSNVERLVTGFRGHCIALDTAAGKIYWGESYGKIMRADLNGTNIETFIANPDYAAETNANLNYRVNGIALDIEGGKIYWAESGNARDDGKIKCANLNGSDIKILVSERAIALDVEDGKMYWAGGVGALDSIKHANLNGADIETLLFEDAAIMGIALDVEGGKIYWSQFDSFDDPAGIIGSIKRINLDGTNIETIVSRIVQPGGIALSFPAAGVSDTAGVNGIIISEIMVASKGGSLPQWIELYNPSDTHAVSLNGWRLEFASPRSSLTLTLEEKSIKSQETLLIVSKQGRPSDNLQNERIYNLSNLSFFRDSVLSRDPDYVLLKEEFYLKLSNAAGKLVDEVGNFDTDDDKSTWSLPKSLTEDGARASMIRRHVNGVPQLGTDESGWVSAINSKLLTGTTSYYGHPDDVGAPGIESGGALPVALSHFRAALTESGVIIKWATESELDNAGFNILRGETRNGEFKVVNPQFIQGAGTTSERHEYTWMDTTAKPNVVYYYRIEDVSHAGDRKQLATVRMRGYVSAAGKLMTKWGDLKLQE